MGDVDLVFRALADPTRRALLDELFARDGQTLVSLTARHDMTRIAVAKHLKILEDAGLIVSRRRGREKLHYLNPVPIRLVHDRWVSKYTEPWAAGLAGLKHELEDQMEKVFEIYIRTTPERLWEAITDPVIRTKYQFGASIESDWTAGSPYRLGHPDAERPLIELSCRDEVCAVHYNSRSIAPLRLAPLEAAPFYAAYRRFAAVLREPRFQLKLHLPQGEIVVFDNQRILHGRTAFSSARHARHLRGCYLTRDSVYSGAAL